MSTAAETKHPRFQPNPVLVKEIKERVRSRRGVVILTVFLVLLGGVMYLVYRVGIVTLRFQTGPSLQFAGPTLGRWMFEALVFCLLGLIGFIGPGISAGSIASERERRTLHLLQLTLLSPRSIVLGKLGASVAFMLLLIVASAPLFSVPLVLGGFTIGHMLKTVLVMICVAILISSIGVYMSSVARRVQFAAVAAYGLVLLYFVGTLIAWGGEEVLRSANMQGSSSRSSRAISVFLNPLVATASASYDRGANNESPLSAIGGVAEREFPGIGRASVNTTTGAIQTALTRPATRRIRIWQVHIVLSLLLSWLLLSQASRRLRAPRDNYTLG